MIGSAGGPGGRGSCVPAYLRLALMPIAIAEQATKRDNMLVMVGWSIVIVCSINLLLHLKCTIFSRELFFTVSRRPNAAHIVI